MDLFLYWLLCPDEPYAPRGTVKDFARSEQHLIQLHTLMEKLSLKKQYPQTVSQQNPDNALYLCETKQLATEENRLMDALTHLDNILKTLAQCLNKKALAQCPGDILWPFGHAY